MDRTLGVRLELITAFGAAAQNAVKELGLVKSSLEEIGKVKPKLDGLTELAAQITNLNQRARNAADRIAGMDTAVSQMGATSRAAAGSVAEVGTAVERVQARATEATEQVFRLTTSLTRLGTIRVDSVGNAMHGIVDEAIQAKRAVDDLEASLMRLSATRLPMLGSGMRDSQGFTQVLPGGRTPIVIPVEYAALPGNAPRALPAGSFSWGGYAPAQAAIGAEEMAALGAGRYELGAGAIPMLTGGTDPTFDARKWWANWRATNGGNGGSGGPPISVPPGGFGSNFPWDKWQNNGDSISKMGNDIQGMGWAASVNGAMLGAGLIGAGKAAMDIDDLLHRTLEALKASGATDENAKKFIEATRRIPEQTGSDYKETVSAGYNFISALPADVQKMLNNPAVLQQIIDAYRLTSQLIVAGSASTHHITMEEGALDINNVIANLGLKTDSPENIKKAYQIAGNLLINLKNQTPTEVDMAAASVKAIGPIAQEMGIDPSVIAGLIGMEAEGKVRGQQAGYAIKRLLQRQSVPSAKTVKLIDTINSMGGDISLFDKDGKTRNLFEYMSDITKFMDTHHLSQKERGYITGQLSGLYALPNLDLMMQQIQKHGGVSGAAAYGRHLLGMDQHGNVAHDVQHYYGTRSQGNMRIEGAKTMAAVQNASMDFFKAAAPDIIEFMHALTGLVKMFDRLPDPVKKALVDFAALTAITSTVSGLFMIFGGNTLKLIGGVVKFAGATGTAIKALREGEQLTGAIGAYQKILGAFGGLAKIAWTGITRGVGLLADGFMFVARAAATAIIGMGPVGWTIMALIAAGALIYTAWTRDWGGIREKTAAVWNWIKEMFQKFPGLIIEVMGPVGMALELIFNKNFRDAAEKGVMGLYNGFRSGVKWAINGVEYIGQAIWQTISGWGTQALHAGEAFIHNLGTGIQNGIKSAPAMIKGALQKVRDLFPGSEPKDGSSPLAGMGSSGEAFSDMFVKGVIDGLIDGSKKVKKAAKPVADALIELNKGEAVSAVEKIAKAIEAEMDKAGARIKDKWITILSGSQATRFYGDVGAVHAAVRQIDNDPAARNARDYIDTVKNVMANYQNVLAKLGDFLAQATTAHTQALIQRMITTVVNEHARAMKQLIAQFTNTQSDPAHLGSKMLGLDAMNSLLSKTNDEADKFDESEQKFERRMQATIDLRKNKEIPSIKELVKELGILQSEKDSLGKTYSDEEAKLAVLQSQYTELMNRIKGLNDADQTQHQIKQQLLAQAETLKGEISDLNDRLTQQAVVLKNVDDQISDYNVKIKEAKAGTIDWANAVKQAFDQATQAAITQFQSTIDNDLTKSVTRIFARWSDSGSPIIQAVGTFAKSFVSSLVGGIVNSVLQQAQTGITSWLNQFVNHLFNGGASPTTGLSAMINGTNGWGQNILSIGGQGFGPTLGGEAIGLGTGVLTGAMMGGGTHTIWGAGLGTLGATLGAIFGGPVGSAIGGAAGGLLGGLFGFAANPTNNPDMFNQQTNWGQDNANLWGAGYGPNANNAMNVAGQGPEYENPQLAQQLGGQGMLQYIAQWIAANPSDALRVLGQGNLALFQGLNVATPVTGGKNGTLDLANGQSMYFSNLYSSAQNAISAIQQFGTNTLTAAQNADRLAASFTSLMLGAPSGFVIPSLIGGTSGGGVGGTNQPVSMLPGWVNNGSGGNTTMSQQQSNGQQTIQVNILQGAQISSDIATEVSNALPKLASAIANAVNQQNYRSQRLIGNYVSAIGS